MQKDVPFSSKRFIMTLALCACSVILLQNGDLPKELPFPISLLGMALGLVLCFAAMIPAIIIKTKMNGDVLALVGRKSTAHRIITAVIYCVCFVCAAVYFLYPYTDMFCKKYYDETSPCLIAFLMLGCCVYAAFKGANVITRFGIFLFVLAMVTNALLCGGSLFSLDFSYGSFALSGSLSDFLRCAIYFVTPCFIAVIFTCLSGSSRQFRLRQPVIALSLTGVKFALVMFFITFSVGEYATRQEYGTFVLSRAAHFGAFAGIESFYMALSTMSVFMIVSLLLCAAAKAVGKEGNLAVTSVFTGVIFIVHLIMVNNNSVKEILTSPVTLISVSLAGAVVVPTVCLITERRKNA